MAETIVSILVMIAGLYLVIGIVFYFPFMKKGVHHMDDGVKSAPRFFKLLIFPGVMALWPLLLRKWKQAKKA